MRCYIPARNVYTPQGVLPGGVAVEDGQIYSVGRCPGSGWQKIDLGEADLLPGLIDLHIHGAYGFDTMDASPSSLNGMPRFLAENGVTSFLATTVTAKLEEIGAALSNVARCMGAGLVGARVLGAYVEGPYLTEAHKGAHSAHLLREACPDELDWLWEQSSHTVRVMAVAPEKQNNLAAIPLLRDKGVRISLAHTDATYAQARAAAGKGATITAHVYNGMRGLHHREVGMLGEALLDDRLYAELICDGVHVSVPAMQLAYRCKGADKIILITDCMMAGGLEDGIYNLGALEVFVSSGVATAENGSLAGSTLKLLDAVKRMHREVGVPFEQALRMATINPARALGIDGETGSIEAGKTADITALNLRGEVIFTMVQGNIVYRKQYSESTLKSKKKRGKS